VCGFGCVCGFGEGVGVWVGCVAVCVWWAAAVFVYIYDKQKSWICTLCHQTLSVVKLECESNKHN